MVQSVLLEGSTTLQDGLTQAMHTWRARGRPAPAPAGWKGTQPMLLTVPWLLSSRSASCHFAHFARLLCKSNWLARSLAPAAPWTSLPVSSTSPKL